MSIKITKEVEDIILNTIDKVVTNTGYPVASIALKAAGIDRMHVRHMVSKGLVIAIDLEDKNNKNGKGTLVKAYYTTRVYPKVLSERDKRIREAEEKKKEEERKKRLVENTVKAYKDEHTKRTKAAGHHKKHKEAAK